MKIWLNKANENWICDSFYADVVKYHPDICTNNIDESDLVWFIADWCWNQVPASRLKGKRVVMSCHHFTPWKITEETKRDFEERKKVVDLFHVPCLNTKNQLMKIFGVPESKIFVRSFWVDDSIWFPVDKAEAKDYIGVAPDRFVISSFQRDTEGETLLPKLEKGPDVFCEYVEQFVKQNPNQKITVLLGAWRRGYIIQRLHSTLGKDYYHNDDALFELDWTDRPAQDWLNQMYSATDLYVVGSRVEGHPMAHLECAATKTPCISTNMGTAELFLTPESIAKNVSNLFYMTSDMKHGKAAGKSLLSCKPNVEESWNKIQPYLVSNGGIKAVLEGIIGGFSPSKKEVQKVENIIVEEPKPEPIKINGKELVILSRLEENLFEANWNSKKVEVFESVFGWGVIEEKPDKTDKTHVRRECVLYDVDGTRVIHHDTTPAIKLLENGETIAEENVFMGSFIGKLQLQNKIEEIKQKYPKGVRFRVSKKFKHSTPQGDKFETIIEYIEKE